MRELDALLLHWLDTAWADAPAGDRRAFGALLALSDPEILDLFTNRLSSEDPVIVRAVEVVLGERLPRDRRDRAPA
jgi:succinate dehydrogenase flavin-adding protein (antitoxin of CptAB toxin-antitoxin module)